MGPMVHDCAFDASWVSGSRTIGSSEKNFGRDWASGPALVTPKMSDTPIADATVTRLRSDIRMVRTPSWLERRIARDDQMPAVRSFGHFEPNRCRRWPVEPNAEAPVGL